MQAIEPNWISLLWFAGFATVGTVVLLIVAGMFPLRTAPDAERSGAAAAARCRQRRPAGGAADRYGTLRLCRTQGEHLDHRRRACRAVCTGPVRDLAIVASRWNDRTCRAGRGAGAGPCGPCQGCGACLGQYIVIVGRCCDACQDQARPVAAGRSGDGPRRLSISIMLGHGRIQYVVAFLGCFMIFAMWLFPEVKRDAPATAKTRSSQ